MATNHEKIEFIRHIFVTPHVQNQMNEHPSIAMLYRSIRPIKKLTNLSEPDFTNAIIDFINGIQKEVDDGTINPQEGVDITEKITEYIEIENSQLGQTQPPSPRAPSPKMVAPSIGDVSGGDSTSDGNIKDISDSTSSSDDVSDEESIISGLTSTVGVDQMNPIPVVFDEESVLGNLTPQIGQETQNSDFMMESLLSEMVGGINQINEHLSDQIEAAKEEEKENDRETAAKKSSQSGGIFSGLGESLQGMGGMIGGLATFIPMLLTSLVSIVGILGAVVLISGKVSFEDILSGAQQLYQSILPSLRRIIKSISSVIDALIPTFKKMYHAVENGLLVAFDWIATTIESITPMIMGGADSVGGAIPQMIDSFVLMFGDIWEMFKSLAGVVIELNKKLAPIVLALVKGIMFILPPIVKLTSLFVQGAAWLTEVALNFSPFFLMPKLIMAIGSKFTIFNTMVTKLVSFWGSIITGWSSLMTRFASVGTYITSMRSTLAPVTTALKNLPLLGKYFSAIGNIFTNGVKAAKGFGSMLKFLPKLFTKLAWPLTLIMGLFDFIDGFQSTQGNILTKISGGFKAAIMGIVEMPLRLIGWIGDKILGLFGIELESGLGGKLVQGFRWVLDNIFNSIMFIPNLLLKTMNWLKDKVIGFVKKIPGAKTIMKGFDAVKGFFNSDKKRIEQQTKETIQPQRTTQEILMDAKQSKFNIGSEIGQEQLRIDRSNAGENEYKGSDKKGRLKSEQKIKDLKEDLKYKENEIAHFEMKSQVISELSESKQKDIKTYEQFGERGQGLAKFGRETRTGTGENYYNRAKYDINPEALEEAKAKEKMYIESQKDTEIEAKGDVILNAKKGIPSGITSVTPTTPETTEAVTKVTASVDDKLNEALKTYGERDKEYFKYVSEKIAKGDKLYDSAMIQEDSYTQSGNYSQHLYDGIEKAVNARRSAAESKTGLPESLTVGHATGGMVQRTGLVKIHAGEVLGPLGDVRSMIQTEDKNEMAEYMDAKNGVKRFDTGIISSLSNSITGAKAKKDIDTLKLNRQNNDILERGQANMVNNLKSLKETNKDSTYVERNNSTGNDTIPNEIENLGIFLTNTTWV